MKILQLNCVYRQGSTGKIVASISDVLRSQGHEVFTCYGVGNDHADDYSSKVCGNGEHYINAVFGRISGIPFGGVHYSNIRVKHSIQDFRPDIVHVHCVNASSFNVYRMLKYLAKIKMKTILTLHAEIFHTAGCSHSYDCEKWKNGCHNCEVYKQRVGSYFFDRSETSYRKMYDAVNSFDKDKLIVTAVSPWLAERAKQSAIMKAYNLVYVPNGVDTSVFHYTEGSNRIRRDNYDRVVLFVTPYFGLEQNDIKGGRFLPQIAKLIPNYKFVVVSNTTSKNLSKLPANIELVGRAKSQIELAQLYSESDLTILLSKRETFSMVTAESLCCGTPVVGFTAGGPESIAIDAFSNFVEYGNIKLLADALINWNSSSYYKQAISEISGRQYSQENMANKFLNIYSSNGY